MSDWVITIGKTEEGNRILITEIDDDGVKNDMSDERLDSLTVSFVGVGEPDVETIGKLTIVKMPGQEVALTHTETE